VKDLDILLQKYKGASEIECEQLSDGECLAEEPYDPVDFPNKAKYIAEALLNADEVDYNSSIY